MKKIIALMICVISALTLSAKDIKDFAAKDFLAAVYVDVDDIMEKANEGKFDKEITEELLTQFSPFFEYDVEDFMYVLMTKDLEYFVVETDIKEALFGEKLKEAYPAGYSVAQNNGLTFHWIPGENIGLKNKVGFAYLAEDIVVMVEDSAHAAFLTARTKGFANPFRAKDDDKLVECLVNIDKIPADITQSDPIASALLAKMKQAFGSLDLVGPDGKTIIIHIDVRCADASAAAQLQIQAQSIMMMFIMGLSQNNASLAQKLQNSIVFEVSGDILSIKGNFDSSLIGELKKNFELDMTTGI